MENAERKKLLSGDAMAEYVEQLVSQILNEFRKEELEEICLIGLQSSGVPLTRRIVRAIREKTGVEFDFYCSKISDFSSFNIYFK